MTSMVPAGGGGGEGGGGNESIGGGSNTGAEQAPSNLVASSPQQQQQQQQPQPPQPPQQHPPPSPLSGCYLLVVLPEPHSAQHKDLILNRLSKGFLSWDKDSCHVDIEKELQALVAQAPEGEEARNGERLIQYATENLVTEVLIYPQSNTLLQCIRNLLASFTKHRHIIHAGYTFGGNGSWILQDGTFSLADFLDAFSEHEVQRVLRAYENSVTVDIHCASVGDWTTTRFSKEICTRACRVRVNPDDVLTSGVPAITNFTNYIGQYLIAQTLDQLMEPSDVVGNIRFSHPTLYVFPGGQGDAALFGINGFNMLVDGGFARKACFWDFARHLDRLDAVLVTRINNSNIGGMTSVLRKKKEMYVYPQIGHFFCNLVERRHLHSPDGDKDIDPLILDLTDIGQEMIINLRHINLRPHPCYRDPEPINLYHKVGHGTLDMYVLSPSKDSREVREFLAKWNVSDSKLFAGSHKKDSNSIIFPIQNLVSICAMLVWQPANPEDTITRILFPGSTPQNKIFEGFERLKHLELLKHPVCTAKSLSPSTSLATLKDKNTILKPKLSSIERETKRLVESRREKRDSSEVKAVKKDPIIEESAAKNSTSKSIVPSISKGEIKTKKVVENKKIEAEAKEKDSKKIEKELKETKISVKKIERFEGSEIETKKTDTVKVDTEKTVPAKDPKLHKTEIKKKDFKDTSKLSTKVSKVDSGTKSSFKTAEKKSKVSGEKKDVIKSSPTTPKKSVSSTTIKVEIPKTSIKSAVKIASKTTSSAPAKSTKDANNRMVVEQKNIELSSMTMSSASKAPLKAKSIERKPLSRRTKPVSPSKARLPISPAKSARSTPSTSVKSDKDAVIRKVKSGTADSSAVSTPTGIESETAIKLIDKNLTEKSEDMSLDSIESKVLADLKEEREVVEEIEAVLQKAERIEARKEERFEADDEITAEATDKKEEDVTEEDVTAEMDDIPKKISRKESQEFTEEDEYLIVEKEEIYTEDSMHSGDTEQKHHLDEAESEKVKEDVKHYGFSQEEEKEFSDEKKDEMPEKQVVDSFPGEKPSAELSPEHKELLKEEMKQIIASAKEVVKKTEEKDETGKRDSEDFTKDPSSLSPDKLDFMQKPEVELKEIAIEKLEESQERISTIESGATTAPTLPEDERIPLDEIKEDVDEKHAIEEVKEKLTITKQKEDIPDILPIVSKAEVKTLDVRPLTQQGIIRDVVKTPDEVADLPVHEEVDPKLYRVDDVDKEKDIKTSVLFQEQKESTIVPTAIPVKETKDKGVFSFFGKVADKFEKGIDKLTKKTRRDSDKDVEDKSSKSSSPKEPKPQEKITIGDFSFDKVSPKIEKSEENMKLPYELKSEEGIGKKGYSLDNSSFLESERRETEKNLVEVFTSPKITLPKKAAGEVVEDVEEVEAFAEEVSKKFINVKDSLHDSLESLNEKADDASKFPSDSKDAITDTLSGVAEKLIDIKPDVSCLLETKEPEKVKFIVPTHEELEDDGDSDGIVRDFKEAVRDVAEVLVGTAGIEIEKEEKPKDVEEIVKKVAEVLKTDDFLIDQSVPTNDTVENSTENLGIQKKIGITAEHSDQEEVEEFLEKQLIDSSTKSYDKSDVFEIKEETSYIDKNIVKTETDKEEAMRLCDDIMKSAERIIDYEIKSDTKQDVMDLGLEEICIKKIAKREAHDEKMDKKIVIQPEISFDQNLSPGKVEYVTVTPGSTPTSPKVSPERQFADLPAECTDIFTKNESLESLIEQFIVSKNHKITMQILEYIATIKRVPKNKIIDIINEIIIKCNISRENVADHIELLRISDNIPLKKRLEIENYIFNQYMNKNKKIILSTIEKISAKEMISKRLVIEIIEETIAKKRINRENVIDIEKDKYLTLHKEDLQTSLEADEVKESSLNTDEISDEKIEDGFVSVLSTEAVKALQSHDDSKTVDDFEAVEQEYKVGGTTSTPSSEKSISEKDKQEMTEDASDVIEADEKFVKETFEKNNIEDDAADKVLIEKENLIDDEKKSIQNIEISESDTKEKYLDEAKEKPITISKSDICEIVRSDTENKISSKDMTKETEEKKDHGKEISDDPIGATEKIDFKQNDTEEAVYEMPQSLLKLSETETVTSDDTSKHASEKLTKSLSKEKQELQGDITLEKIAGIEKIDSVTDRLEDIKKSPSIEQEVHKIKKSLDTLEMVSDEVKSSIKSESNKFDTSAEITEIFKDLNLETAKTSDKSKSPSVVKEVQKTDISSDTIQITKHLKLVTDEEKDKVDDNSKSPSMEKQAYKIDITSDITEISKDLKSASDKMKDKLRSPNAESDINKMNISLQEFNPIDAIGITKDLQSVSYENTEKEVQTTVISSKTIENLENLKALSDKVFKDKTKSPSPERKDEKIELDDFKPGVDSRSSCTEEEIKISDILLEKSFASEDSTLSKSKLDDWTISKLEIKSPSIDNVELKDLLHVVAQKEDASKRTSPDKNFNLDDTKAMDILSEKVKLSDETIVAEIDMPKNLLESSNADKNAVLSKVLLAESYVLKDESKSQIIEEKVEMSNITDKSSATEEVKEIDTSACKSKSPSSEKEILEKPISPTKGIILDDKEAVTDELEDRSGTSSVEKEESVIKQMKPKDSDTEDTSKSPGMEKETVQIESSFIKNISTDDLKEVVDKLEYDSKSSEKIIIRKDSKEVESKIDGKSKSPIIEREETTISFKKVTLMEDMKPVSDQSEDILRSASLEKRTNDLSEKEMLSDRSKSLSTEHEVAQNETLLTTLLLTEDLNLVSDNLEDKRRSASVEKDEKKMMGASNDLTDQPILLEKSAAITEETEDGSKYKHAEKEVSHSEILLTKQISSEDIKTVFDKSEKSRSPSTEKDEKTTKYSSEKNILPADSKEEVEESKNVSITYAVEKPTGDLEDSTNNLIPSEILLKKINDRTEVLNIEEVTVTTETSFVKPESSKDLTTAVDKSEDRLKSPEIELQTKDSLKSSVSEVISKSSSPEKDKPKKKDLNEKETLSEILVEAVGKMKDITNSSSSEKEAEVTEISILKLVCTKDSKAVHDELEQKCKSPSEQEEKKNKDSFDESLVLDHSKVTIEKPADISKSENAEKKLEPTEYTFDKSKLLEKSSSNEIMATTEISVSKDPLLEEMKAPDTYEEKSRLPSAENNDEKTKDAYEKDGLPADSIDKSFSFGKTEILDENIDAGSKSVSIEKQVTQAEISMLKNLRSSGVEQNNEKVKDSYEVSKLLEDSESVEKSEDVSKTLNIEKSLVATDDSINRSLPFEETEAVSEKTDSGSKSPSIEKEEVQMEISVRNDIPLEDMKAMSDKSEAKYGSLSADIDEEKTTTLFEKHATSEDSEVLIDKAESASKSSSEERNLLTSEFSTEEKIDGELKSPGAEKEATQTKNLVTKEILLEDKKIVPGKAGDNLRSPSTEQDDKKTKDSYEFSKFLEDTEVIGEKSDVSKSSFIEKTSLGCKEDKTSTSMQKETMEEVIEKSDGESKFQSIEKDIDQSEIPVTKEILLEVEKTGTDKIKEKLQSSSAEQDVDKTNKLSNLLKDTESIIEKSEDMTKSSNEEKILGVKEKPADTIVQQEKIEEMYHQSEDRCKSPSVEKEEIEMDISVRNNVPVEDTEVISDKSEVRLRSPGAEKDEDKSSESFEQRMTSNDLEVVTDKAENISKSESVEKTLGTVEDSSDNSVVFEKFNIAYDITDNKEPCQGIRDTVTQTEISVEKEISSEDLNTVSGKSEAKSSSPSAEKDIERTNESNDKLMLSKDSELVGEKSKDTPKSDSVEKKLEKSEHSTDKVELLEISNIVTETTHVESKSLGIQKEVAQTEISVTKEISLEDRQTMPDKFEAKYRSPSAEKDEEKTTESAKKIISSEDSEVVISTAEEMVKPTMSAEKILRTSIDITDKGVTLEKSNVASEMTDVESRPLDIQKEGVKTEILVAKEISLDDPNATIREKNEQKSKDSTEENIVLEDSEILIDKLVEPLKPSYVEKEIEQTKTVEPSKSIFEKSEEKTRSPSTKKEEDKSKDSSENAMILEDSKVATKSMGIEKDEKQAEILISKEISLEGSEAKSEEKSRSPSADSSQKSGDLEVQLSGKADPKDSKSSSLVCEKSLQEEFAESKASVTSTDNVVEDKGRDRSRSHSVFESGDKSPLIRSRAASLYEDKLIDKLAILELTKDSPSNKDNSFKETDEFHSSKESLNDLQKEILKEHLENEHFANIEIKKLITDYILNEFISKNKIISNQIINDLANNYNIDRHIVTEIIDEVISHLKLERKMVLNLENKLFDEPIQKILEDEEKLTIIINDEYIAKKKIINSNTIDEIARNATVSRHLVILVIENIITASGLCRESIVSADAFETDVLIGKDESEIVTEFTQSKEEDKLQPQPTVSTKEQSKITVDTKQTVSPSSELKTTFYKSKSPEPQIDEEINISENKRTEIEALIFDDYINRGIKITESILEQIVIRTSLPKYIIVEIIEEIIIKKGLGREITANLSIFCDEECSDSQEKAAVEITDSKLSDYSPPEPGRYNDGLEKSLSYTDYESPFHKAFIGGMTEIRTTHITTLSGKSTPELGLRDGLPDSSSDIVSKAVSRVTNVSEKEEKTTDKKFDDYDERYKSQCKVDEEKEPIKRSSDEIKTHDEVCKSDKEELKPIMNSHLNDNLERTRQFIEQESLLSKISSDKELDHAKKDSVGSLIKSAEVSNEEEKLISSELQSIVEVDDTTGKSIVHSKQQEGGEKVYSGKDLMEHSESDQLEQNSTLTTSDLTVDANIVSKKSTTDVPLGKDAVYSDSTGKSTPQVSMSPLIRDGSMIQSHLSGRSTPDKRSDNRSRTATPEGFRSGDVIRTIITTTRTMSDDGEIITTTREVTEATNEKGETIVLTEKTDIKVDDKLPENFMSEDKACDVPSSEVTDKEADLTSPKSDLSSGHSRAATNVWGSSEERHTYSDEEQSSPPLFSSLYPSEQIEGETPVKIKEDIKSESMSSAAMSSSFYGELPSEPAHFGSSLTRVSDTVSFTEQDEFSFKKFTVEKEYAGGYESKGSKKYVDEADLDFEKALTGLEGEKGDSKRGLNLEAAGFSQELEKSSSSHSDEKKKDPLADWGSPLSLPSPKAPRKFNLRSPIQACSSADLSPDSLNFDVINDWGEPMRLPSPAPASNELSNKGSPGTPKKEKKQAKKVISENLKNKKRSESPNKNEKKLKDSKNKVQPVYLDLAYVAHHGNSFYTALEFFKKIRARYYVFSGTEPSREVYDALLEAKKTWDDKELEVTMIPTYDTDTLGYWVADNEEALAAHHIDLSPSASRCTINLQDHETSCSAYRLEF